MATYTAIHIAATGGTYRAFPFSETNFTNWATRKVALTESGATGKYSGTLDDTYGLSWGVFASDAEPTSFAQAVAIIDLQDEKLASLASSLQASVIAVQKLAEADRVSFQSGGVYYERVTERGTASQLIPDKKLKQSDGTTDVTNPSTQFFGGSVQE